MPFLFQRSTLEFSPLNLTYKLIQTLSSLERKKKIKENIFEKNLKIYLKDI